MIVHKVRTLFGDSEITYDWEDLWNWENYSQSVLQGNASGPTLWSLLSSIICKILYKRGFAVIFCTSLSKQVFQLIGFEYVDNCDFVQSVTDPTEEMKSMQKSINSWGL